MLTEIGAYDDLKSTLIPMVSRRFSNGSTERYREPLLSINRNLLTIKLIRAAEAAGVKFEYGTGYAPGDVDVATGSVRLGEGLHCKPRVIVGCDGVHGKVSKIINPTEAERSSRASEWGYYELNLPGKRGCEQQSSRCHHDTSSTATVAARKKRPGNRTTVESNSAGVLGVCLCACAGGGACLG